MGQNGATRAWFLTDGKIRKFTADVCYYYSIGELSGTTNAMLLLPKTTMKITIEIGETEKSKINYEYNQLLGWLTITVNNERIAHSIRLLNEPVLEVHTIQVGNHEKHEIRIEKQRRQLLGHRSRIFIDNRLREVISSRN